MLVLCHEKSQHELGKGGEGLINSLFFYIEIPPHLFFNTLYHNECVTFSLIISKYYYSSTGVAPALATFT